MKRQTISNGGAQSYSSAKITRRAEPPKLMKNFRIFIMALVTSMISSASFQARAEMLPSTPLQSVFSQIASPDAMVRWMKQHLKFVDDSKLFGNDDYWQDPAEMIQRGAGDCEDYALFAKSVLDHLGIEAYVVSFYGPNNYAHTIVIYKQSEGYNVINEDRLYRYQAKTIEDALTRVHSHWTWGGIAEKQGRRGSLIFALQNPSTAPRL